MESGFLDKQRIIQASSHILWIMQLTKDVLKDDEQYILRVTP